MNGRKHKEQGTLKNEIPGGLRRINEFVTI
jgi:hypothetical protein